MTKEREFLTTVPLFTWWLADKIEDRRRKKRNRNGVDVIDNLERLHRFKERGVISEEDFQELKEKMKKRI